MKAWFLQKKKLGKCQKEKHKFETETRQKTANPILPVSNFNTPPSFRKIFLKKNFHPIFHSQTTFITSTLLPPVSPLNLATE